MAALGLGLAAGACNRPGEIEVRILALRPDREGNCAIIGDVVNRTPHNLRGLEIELALDEGRGRIGVSGIPNHASQLRVRIGTYQGKCDATRQRHLIEKATRKVVRCDLPPETDAGCARILRLDWAADGTLPSWLR